MNRLRRAVDDYLQTRRALGFKLTNEEGLLRSFLAYMDTVGADTVTTADAVSWATLSDSAKPLYQAKRLRAVREFARYLAPSDPATEIPASDLLQSHGWMRPTQFIYNDQRLRTSAPQCGYRAREQAERDVGRDQA